MLHQAALLTAKPHPWALNSTACGLLPLPRRRGAPAIRSAATDGSIIPDAAPPSKKTRKEKQLDRSREQDMQHRQRQLLMQASLPKANAGSGGGGGGNKEELDDDELPQPVFDRILRRIVVAVGLPMASGVGLLNLYDVLKRNQGMEVPSWVPLLTILVSFGTSALGIAYGTLSASWDPEKEGSLLGIDEARANWPVLWAEEIEKEKAKARKKK
ncbi:hypothetical protein PR202_ga07672 [Eleusine coracana subsp. coracana]|uniref:Uncharacterized protein n=1 Tax=Eleusine coracana subsp. coracana TaxID=191504 RepID=A0AAV5C056_ELECO|nr:hypothetical protein PR202_ga07672 [Eleusine coracana subsp. coracana]